MTIQIKHAFTSAKGDGGDATLVRPSNWNAVHTTSMATLNILGRLTAGAGAFEEIPITALVAAALNSADGAAFLAALGVGGFDTGDIKYTFRTSAPTGWVMLLGGTGTPPSTIGSASSSAILRANADCLDLYTIIWNACADAEAPVSGGRGANAAADFAANKTIRIPNLVGRAPIGAGSATDAPPSGGGATTAKTLGKGYGAETVTLLTANLPPYTPAGTNGTVTVTSTVSDIARTSSGSSTGGGAFGFTYPAGYSAVTSTGSGPTFNGTPQGGTSTPVDKIHSSVALNVLVKL